MTGWNWHHIGTRDQLIAEPPLFEPCPVCGVLTYGQETGVHGRPHKGCGAAVDRWVRARLADDIRQAQ